MGDFLKKAFHGGTNFFGQIMGEVSYMGGGLMIRSCQGGRESFTNAFYSNLNTVNLKVLPDHGRIYT